MARAMVTGLLFAVTALCAVVSVQARVAPIKDRTASNTTLRVFFIPHSHQDAGWLKTIDEYYEQEVKYVYNTVIDQLSKRSDRKFIIVEMIFFSRWFNSGTDDQRSLVRQFVSNKQIEFVLGGWVMNDDADPTYSASINQMAEGHKWIFETFGVIPRYGWHIDPFGLSSYYPALFAKMGFNGHVINRIHYLQKEQWKSEQHLEFIWRGTKSLGTNADVLTHVLDSHYSFPSGFNFETDAPITYANIETRAQALVAELNRRASWYRTDNLLIPGGDDFRWQNAEVQYTNWDKLIDYINTRQSIFNVDIRYSTLSDYFEALHAAQVSWPVYEEDFFPYADGYDAYWTGYFTSYSNLKGYIRTRATLLRTAEVFSQAAAFAGSALSKSPELLVPLRQATAESQHHDGVTGTSKNKVVKMYEEHLATGSAAAEEIVTAAVAALVGESSPLTVDASNINNLANGQAVPIVVSNGLGWNRVQEPFDFVIDRADIEIVDSQGNVAPYQLTVLESGKVNVTFLVDVPAGGFSTYFARPTSNPVVATITEVAVGRNVFLDNGALFVNATISAAGVATLYVSNRLDGSYFPIRTQLLEYTSYSGSGQKSGAYIFKPVGAAAPLATNDKIYLIDGPVAQSISHRYDARHGQVFRLFKSSNPEVSQFIQAEYSIGVLDQDRETIARFSSNIFQSDLVHLYSDNNGILMHKRPAATGMIAANYYPFVSQAYLSDGQQELLLVSDRTLGVASLEPGQIEAMLHRRCSQDDGRGVGEALDDTSVVYPHLRLFLGSASSIEKIRPRVNVIAQHDPVAFYGPITTVSAWTSTHTVSYSALQQPLPDNVHLLALKTDIESNWKEAVLRLQHIYETGSDARLSQPVNLDITTLLNARYTVSEELELSGRLPQSEVSRLPWTAGSVTPPWTIPSRLQPASIGKLPPGRFKFSTPRKLLAVEEEEDQATQFNPMEIHVVRLTFV